MTSEDEQRNFLEMADQSPQGMYLVKIVKDSAQKPVDWIFLYCNEAMAKIGIYSVEQLTGKRFTELFPNASLKWLDSYCRAAYQRETLEFDEFSEEIGTYLHLKVIPVEQEDCCCCYIRDTKKELSDLVDNFGEQEEEKRNDALLQALCAEFTVVYLCDLKKDTLETIKMSPYSHSAVAEQKMPKEDRDKYSARFRWIFDHIVIKESAPDYWEQLKPENLMKALAHQDRFEIRHRTVCSLGGQEYFSLKAARLSFDAESFRVVIGIAPIGAQVRKEQENQKRLEMALKAEETKNEIISALSTMYKEIAIVNLEDMTYELVSGPDNVYVQKGHRGTVAQLKMLLLHKNVFGECREEVEEFIDFTTLSDRLCGKKYITMELKAISGKWYACTFIVKKRDDAGNVVRVLMAVHDINEQKRQELEYQEKLKEAVKQAEHAKEEADRANDAKSNFLRRMSHDIRTPINGIRGMLEIADYYAGDVEKLKECRKKIWHSTDHLLSLVNDILDMSKLESGKLILKHEPFSLQKVLEEVNTISAIQAEEANIQFINQKEAEVEHDKLLGSPVYLKRIFLNFTSNAIKYNREGGQVRVHGREISFDGKTAWYEFVCEDTGIGMSEEFQQHAFEPFTQEEKNNARTTYAGTGLGLAITRQLIDLMGGTLELHSKEQVGTKVVFRIPLDVDPAGEEEKETVDYDHILFPGVHILLAEDNELNAEIATFMLEQHSIQVTWVRNGYEAVEQFLKTPDAFDLIFMDIMMPELDGLSAARQIRTSDAGKEIPIVAMTANAFMDDIQRSLDAGMNAHLTKPLQEEEIVRTIQKLIKSRK